MSTFMFADSDPIQPAAGMPYLEKDGAILRGVTKAFFDYSNPETYAGTGPLAIGVVFNNLVEGGGSGGVTGAGGTTFPPIYHGTVRTLGMVTGANGSNLTLPTSFMLSGTSTRFLSVFWLRMSKVGWPAVSTPKGLMGWGSGSPAATQYAVTVVFDATGAVSALRWTVYGMSGVTVQTIQLQVTSAAVLDKILDGTLHQIGCAFEIIGGVGIPSLYVDGELVATGVGGAIAALNVVATQGQLFGLSAAGSVTQPGYHELDTRIGRPQLHDLTSHPEIAFTDILKRDKNSAYGYLS
ncbi:hypothetical protein [Pseudomonas sp. PS01297]|uniref:hypothetical protein n=1 Tax=Pseudomonas sp. PS01297 TaxID=2991433 RepID=UPI00249C2B74|nr:hypothetical protein [Pseudomonas sp. PS01297]